MKKIVTLALGLALITSIGCKQAKKEAEEVSEQIEETIVEPITLTKLEGSPAYADAELVLSSQKSSYYVNIN